MCKSRAFSGTDFQGVKGRLMHGSIRYTCLVPVGRNLALLDKRLALSHHHLHVTSLSKVFTFYVSMWHDPDG